MAEASSTDQPARPAGVAARGRRRRVRAPALGTTSWRAQVDLRLAPGQPEAERAVAAVLGVELPSAPGAVATAADLTILWLGPDEWLIVARAGREGARSPASCRTR